MARRITRAGVLVCAIAGLAIVSWVGLGDEGRRVPETLQGAIPPYVHHGSGLVPRTMDATRMQAHRLPNGDRMLVGPGQGPLSGLMCVSIRSDDGISTGCDTPEAIAERGVTMVRGAGPTNKAVWIYLPAGFSGVRVQGQRHPAERGAVSFTVARDVRSATLAGAGAGAERTIALPGQ